MKNPVVFDGEIKLSLNTYEAGALQAICGYGPKVFIEWFHKTHGTHYLAPYIDAIPSLFEKGANLDRIVKERTALNKRRQECMAFLRQHTYNDYYVVEKKVVFGMFILRKTFMLKQPLDGVPFNMIKMFYQRGQLSDNAKILFEQVLEIDKSLKEK